MSQEEYQGLIQFTVHQMTGDNVLIRDIPAPYLDLDVPTLLSLISNPDLAFGEGNGLVHDWTATPVSSGGSFFIEDNENRCYVNHEQYIKIKFPDGVVSISAIIFVYCNQESSTGKKGLLHPPRYPFNIHLEFGGVVENADGTFQTVYSTPIEDKPYAIYQFAKEKQDDYVNPYDIPELDHTFRKDIHQAVICSAEFPDKPFIAHNCTELLFKLTGDIQCSAYDLHRVFIFGANSVTCRPPSSVFHPVVQPHQTNMLNGPQGILPGTGGPNSCLDIISTQDETNCMTYVYGPYTTLPEHYVYLANNHSGDLFTKANINAFYYDENGVDTDVIYQVPDLNISISANPTTYYIEISPCDIYQFNFEHTGSAISPTSALELQIEFSTTTGEQYNFFISPADHESLATKHKRSRGVVSMWFPGFPWDNNRKTCIVKDCNRIELTVSGVNTDAEEQVVWRSLLIRTLNPSFICNVSEDITIPPVSNKPNQNSNPIILVDTGASNLTWNESKQVWTHSHVVTPAWNINEYPYYDTRKEEYNILDSVFKQYFLSTGPIEQDLTRITDGYFHVDDPFVGGTSTIKFSTSCDIYHIRVYFAVNCSTTDVLNIGVTDSNGNQSPIRPVQVDVPTIQNANTTNTVVNIRTHPWTFPFSEALFGNVSELTISTSNTIIGFFLWGAYIK